MIVRHARKRGSTGGGTAILTMAALVIGVPASAPAAGQSAGQIVSQPARDVGLEKTKIPPLLLKVRDHPYTTAGAGSCAQIASSIAALNGVIGPDFSSSPAKNRTNIAKIGGSAVVNSLIPFRGIVRAVSGASAAEQRKNAAIDAGIARRGFLHGLAIARRCG